MRLILTSVSFEGFQSDNRKAEVKFSGQQTSIIFGGNGCGKTTFLKLLHAVLSKDSAELIKGNVFRVIIEYVDQFDLAHAVEIRRTRGLAENAEELFLDDYDWSDLESSSLSESTSLSLGVERGVSTQALAIEPIDISRYLNSNADGIKLPRSLVHDLSERLAYFLTRQSTLRNRQNTLRSRGRNSELQLEQEHSLLQNINISNIEGLLVDRYRVARNYASEKIQNALFDTLALAIDSKSELPTKLTMPTDLDSQIIAGKERIMEALADGPENNFKERVINILSGIQTIEDVSAITNNDILCQLIWNMLKELKLEKQLLNSINLFTETFDSFLGENKRLSITHEGVYIKIGIKKHQIDTLSSGERHLFTFLALVVIVARDRNFLIIDEPEISLNPQWQRNLIGLLQQLAPETQIIVASHSPMLAKGRPGQLVELNPVEFHYSDY
ncbi:AAA family ATPase [uncultured Pseudomonas sp.]|uniref:AAA family ATPase n=1 Tax=uncultured Pseudomonas sp. TaxID=114707 RepID=UPI002589B7C8|nr:AAA family ATPase [uncultured Pseudomonas sp.]